MFNWIIRSIVRSFVYLFIYLFVCPIYDRSVMSVDGRAIFKKINSISHPINQL